MDLSKSCFESRDPAPRKQWSTEPSDTVLQVLANASLVSSDSVTSTGWTFTSSTHEGMVAAEFHFLKGAKISGGD